MILIANLRPSQLVHLSYQSHVCLSFNLPQSTDVETTIAILTLLENFRELPLYRWFFHAF